MSTDTHAMDIQTCLDRLCQAMNSHDMEAFLQCFHATYASDQPAHPSRRFSGHAQVRENWEALFTGVPDFQAELLRSSITDDMLWTEWRWYGTRTDGSAFDMRGVALWGVEAGRIAWGRLYMEPVELSGAGIDSMIRMWTEEQRREP
jgi:ketosteroid isomerase-like protein